MMQKCLTCKHWMPPARKADGYRLCEVTNEYMQDLVTGCCHWVPWMEDKPKRKKKGLQDGKT